MNAKIAVMRLADLILINQALARGSTMILMIKDSVCGMTIEPEKAPGREAQAPSGLT